MSEPMQNVQPIKQSIKPLQTFVKGRIVSSRANPKGGFFTLVRCPAADEYSMPALLSISTKTRQGQPDDDFQGLCVLSGAPTSFSDRQTGEVVHSANHYITLVE